MRLYNGLQSCEDHINRSAELVAEEVNDQQSIQPLKEVEKISRMLYLWIISLILCLSISMVYGKQLVCVIGAGISGLSSAKYLAEYPNEFEIVVFEKNSDVGGIWIYTDSTTVDEHGLPVHSSIYKNLRINTPKNLVFFPNFPEFKGENRSFASHWDVHQYLRNFTDHFNLWQHIKLNTNVEKVRPFSNKRWLVTTQNLNTKTRTFRICDAVMVGNGQDTKPNIPQIPGIKNFSGRVLHSHFYRKPEDFTGQTVVTLGAGVSGVEISIDISKFAEAVYLSHRNDKLPSKFPENMQQVVGVTGAKRNELILSDGSKIKADVLLLCTGYVFDFPFLDATSGITVEGGKYVRYVYKHFINIERPTMALLNIPTPGIRTIIPRTQVQYFIAVLRGQLKLPSKQDMLKDAELPPGTTKNKAHYMFLETFSYYDQLAEAASFPPLPPYVVPAFLQLYSQYIADPGHYKEQNIIIHDDNRFEFVNLTLHIEHTEYIDT